MSDEKQALKHLAKLAELKASEYIPELESQGKRALESVNVDPEMAARVAALAKLATEGTIDYGIGDFKVGAKITPEERALNLKYKIGF